MVCLRNIYINTLHKIDNEDDDDDDDDYDDNDINNNSNTFISSGISEENDGGEFYVVHIPYDRLTYSL